MKIKVIRFRDDLKLPERAHYNDAGADVFTPNDIHVIAHETIKMPLGFGLEIPDGYMGCIYPKSGMTANGIIVHIPPIDSGYRGVIHALITNTTNEDYFIAESMKVGQLVITPVILAEFVEELENNRGSGAFGSTGK